MDRVDLTQASFMTPQPIAQTSAPVAHTMADVEVIMDDARCLACVWGACSCCLSLITCTPWIIAKIFNECFPNPCLSYTLPPFKSECSLALACFNPQNCCREPESYLLPNQRKIIDAVNTAQKQTIVIMPPAKESTQVEMVTPQKNEYDFYEEKESNLSKTSQKDEYDFYRGDSPPRPHVSFSDIKKTKRKFKVNTVYYNSKGSPYIPNKVFYDVDGSVMKRPVGRDGTYVDPICYDSNGMPYMPKGRELRAVLHKKWRDSFD